MLPQSQLDILSLVNRVGGYDIFWYISCNDPLLILVKTDGKNIRRFVCDLEGNSAREINNNDDTFEGMLNTAYDDGRRPSILEIYVHSIKTLRLEGLKREVSHRLLQISLNN